MPELTITSPYVHSSPESTPAHLPWACNSICQSRLYPPVRDFGFGLTFLYYVVSSSRRTNHPDLPLPLLPLSLPSPSPSPPPLLMTSFWRKICAKLMSVSTQLKASNYGPYLNLSHRKVFTSMCKMINATTITQKLIAFYLTFVIG